MGTLIGHVGPGFGFFVIGLWHLYNHLKILGQKKGVRSYKSQVWFPFPYLGGLLRRMELYLIIAGSTLSVAMELLIGPHKHHPFDTDGTIPSNHLHNFEHSSISLTFLVYALFAIALDKWVTNTVPAPAPAPAPAQQEILRLIAALAFAQQLLMFHLHSADHMGVEGQYHVLLQLVVFVSLITTLLDIGDSSFVLGFARSLSIMFQGVWLMLMGFALWTPSLIPKGCFIHQEEGHKVVRCHGEESLHRAKALVNIQFSWLLILLAVLAASSYFCVIMLYGGTNVKYTPMLSTTQQDEHEDEDVEAQTANTNFVQTHSFADNNNRER